MKLIVEAGSVRELVSKKSGQVFKIQAGGLLKTGRRVPERVEWFVRDSVEMAPGEYAVSEDWFRVGPRGLSFEPAPVAASARAAA